jgi:assimilatory nitrate reductase catalytic subunit
VKIPEYKVSAAAVERLDQPERAFGEGPTINYSAETAPKMFPYAVGETKAPAESEGKRF